MSTLVFGVRNLKIKPMLTDPAGGAMTYGTEISVVGVNSANFSLTQEQVEARGDDKVLGVVSTPAGLQVDFSVAKTDLEALALLLGGTYSCTGASAPYTKKLEFTGNEYADYIGMSFEAITDEGETFAVVIAKAKASQIAANFADKAFASPTFQAVGVPPNGTTKMWSMSYSQN